jgi:glutamine---fructose-6-phosphate transaminase (isomerizing)
MCGIFGLVTAAEQNLSYLAWNSSVQRLFELSETRGKEAAGIAVATPESIQVYKDSTSATRMVRSKSYRAAIDEALTPCLNDAGQISCTVAAIGHSRLVTNGLQGIAANNQPVWRGDAVLVHNGIVTNVNEMWAKHDHLKAYAEVDTEVIGAIVDDERSKGSSPLEAVKKAFADIYGETSIALFLKDSNELVLATNTGSIYIASSKASKSLFFASEKYICELLIGEKGLPGFEDATIQQVGPDNAAVVDLGTLEIRRDTLQLNGVAAPAVSSELAVNRHIDDNAQRDLERMQNLRRCSKCALPETFPYIYFDHDGVCNYCHTYEPIEVLDDAEVFQMLEKHRRTDDEPDSIVAFSGGRDSSYGLHLMVEKYGMRPMAYTYDWGMVTDLARRNQARMCGKLGIEHIWISANIKSKRANIRANVSAWLKQPDLAMIPLFMAGDKQFMWYANQTMKQTGIDLMVFSTNRLEKTDFKTGFLGVAPKDSKMRAAPSTMAALDKVNMMWQYGSRLLRNPRYLNRSIPDTLWAFMSYYGINQDHLYLFDYIKWDEDETNRTLIDTYDWETAVDTDTTWRIGDGTAPFYNYIYHSVAGFTEFDTFRSNQIREGDITREFAMDSIMTENRPRWRSIKEYLQLINMDFDDTIRVIDRIPKLYSEQNLEKIRRGHEKILKTL